MPEEQSFILDEFGNPIGLGLEMHTENQMAAAVAQMGTEFTCAAPSDVPVDNPLDWMVRQSQSLYPFCHASARTTSEEILYFVATGGKVIQLSRRFATITNLRQDGNDKRAAGASIPGSVMASKGFGNVPEELCQYFRLPKPGEIRSSSDANRFVNANYSNKIDSDILKKATEIRIQNFVRLKSYDDMDSKLITGNFAVIFGIPWHTGWTKIRGTEFVNKVQGGSPLGGHALACGGWKTRAGERWHKIHNSHDGWGVEMAAYLSPAQWDHMIRTSQYGFYAVSDMAVPDQPRGWQWLEQANHSLGGAPIQWV